MRFFNFFLNQMTQKYQNEKSPILNGQNKSKTSEKVQKMRDLEGPTSFHPFENTLYLHPLQNGIVIQCFRELLQQQFQEQLVRSTVKSKMESLILVHIL